MKEFRYLIASILFLLSHSISFAAVIEQDVKEFLKYALSSDEIPYPFVDMDQTIFTGKSKLRALEDENSKFKRLVTDQALDIIALKNVVSRKW